MSAKKPPKTQRAAKTQRKRRSVEDRIRDLKDKIQELETRRLAREAARDPVYKFLRSTRSSLRKAVEQMDGRTNKLDAGFIRASRQYLNLLERALDEVAGKRRRGRKPKVLAGKIK